MPRCGRGLMAWLACSRLAPFCGSIPSSSSRRIVIPVPVKSAFSATICCWRTSNTSLWSKICQGACPRIPIFKIGILIPIILGMAKNPEHRDLFPGALEIMILQSLRLKPMHGYALVKHIKQVSDDLLQVEEGSLYPALQRMLKEGWLKRRLEFRPRVGQRGFTGSRMQAFVISKAKSSVSKRCLPALPACLPQPKHRRCAIVASQSLLLPKSPL